MDTLELEIAGIVVIMLLYVLRLVYKARKDAKQWYNIDKDWRPAAAARRPTDEFAGKS